MYGVVHCWKILFLKLSNLKTSAPLSSYHIGLLDTKRQMRKCICEDKILSEQAVKHIQESQH